MPDGADYLAAVYYNRSGVQNVHLLFLMPYEYLTVGVKSQEKKKKVSVEINKLDF